MITRVPGAETGDMGKPGRSVFRPFRSGPMPMCQCVQASLSCPPGTFRPASLEKTFQSLADRRGVYAKRPTNMFEWMKRTNNSQSVASPFGQGAKCQTSNPHGAKTLQNFTVVIQKTQRQIRTLVVSASGFVVPTGFRA